MNTNKILLVDDDKDILLSLTIRLKASGYQVVQATDAISAMSVARKELPDLIILDLGLPAGDGWVVMERLKALPQTASIPVIVLTAHDAEGNQERAHEAGAVDFLQKPDYNNLLLTSVQSALMRPHPQSPSARNIRK
jgi:putative two-component system response regulator